MKIDCIYCSHVVILVLQIERILSFVEAAEPVWLSAVPFYGNSEDGAKLPDYILEKLSCVE